MSRSYTSSPPSASMAYSGTALPFKAVTKFRWINITEREKVTNAKRIGKMKEDKNKSESK
jgi:hypothetical protein